jgi:hypothetical protein
MTERTIEVRCANGCRQLMRFAETPPEVPGATEGHVLLNQPDETIELRRPFGWDDLGVEQLLRVQALIPGQKCGECAGALSFAMLDGAGAELLVLASGTSLFE